MSDSSTPPPRPWRTGKHNGYSCVEIKVKVAQDDKGWVFSHHEWAKQEDAVIAGTWSGAGIKQVAYALTTESLRREAHLCLLVELSKDGALDQLGDPEFTERLVSTVSHAALAQTMGMAQKMLPDIAKEVVQMAVTQASRTEANPAE
jgi:hypothetical protein